MSYLCSPERFKAGIHNRDPYAGRPMEAAGEGASAGLPDLEASTQTTDGCGQVRETIPIHCLFRSIWGGSGGRLQGGRESRAGQTGLLCFVTGVRDGPRLPRPHTD